MDFSALAIAVVSALMPLFKDSKVLEEVGKKTVDEVFDSRQKIWERLKDLFNGEELISLNLSDSKEQGRLEGKLEEKLKLEANLEIAKELENLVEIINKLSQIQPESQSKSNEMHIRGSENIGMQDVHSSSISINTNPNPKTDEK